MLHLCLDVENNGIYTNTNYESLPQIFKCKRRLMMNPRSHIIVLAAMTFTFEIQTTKFFVHRDENPDDDRPVDPLPRRRPTGRSL
jgi:hypothetical protein